jgi:hypothetical protein
VNAATAAQAQVRALAEQLALLRSRAQGAVAEAIAAFEKKAAALAGAGGGRGGGRRGGGRGGAPAGPETLGSITGSLTTLIRILEAADVTPSAQVTAAVADRHRAAAGLIAQWNALKGAELAALNAQLKGANLPAVTAQ